jgi:hypothetical protein
LAEESLDKAAVLRAANALLLNVEVEENLDNPEVLEQSVQWTFEKDRRYPRLFDRNTVCEFVMDGVAGKKTAGKQY